MRRRCVPLTSNVRPRENRMRIVAHTVEAHRTAAAKGSSLHRRVEQHTRCVGVGRPSVGGRRTGAARQPLLQHLLGLSVLRRPARHWFGSEEDGTLHAVKRRVFVEAELEHQRQTTGGRSVMPRLCVSLALRSTAAPGRWGRAGIGFAHAGGVGALGYDNTQRKIQMGLAVPSLARSNPSVKRTHNGGAQLRAPSASAAPSCAAYLKR